MPTPLALSEFRQRWLPHTPRSAVVRLTELLRNGSPLLIHGRFSQTAPQGCLATQIAWHHPATRHLDTEAGITWLTSVAGLNPATSNLILEWDRNGVYDFQLRQGLLSACEDVLEERVTVDNAVPCLA